MKKIMPVAMYVCMLAPITAVMAQGKAVDNPSYIGANFGVNSITDFGKASALGLVGGYSFTPSLALEFAMSHRDSATITQVADADVVASAMALYGAYRKPIKHSPFFVKSKLGFSKNKLDATVYVLSAQGSARAVTNTNEFSYGLGVGLDANPIGFEIEYTALGSKSRSFGCNLFYKF